MPAHATWRKGGLVFTPDGSRPWLSSHAQMPVALPLGADRSRVFFASRDQHQRSHVVRVDVELGDNGQLRVIEGPAAEPVLAPGPLGCFDDHGVYPASLVRLDDDHIFMYYVGWNPGARPPLFYAAIGLAVSENGGGTFRRLGAAPIMARSEHDPCLVTSPCVIREDGRWRMWYVSGFRWEERAGALESYYHVKYAESLDGVAWQREGRVAIDLLEGERNVARPCVVPGGDGYRMWYSFNRGEGYRIGCAESADGLSWERRDRDAGIAPSPEGWDSEALAYPWVFAAGSREVMLYNGNGYGRDGFGAALRELA
jgi:hypothetical protein